MWKDGGRLFVVDGTLLRQSDIASKRSDVALCRPARNLWGDGRPVRIRWNTGVIYSVDLSLVSLRLSAESGTSSSGYFLSGIWGDSANLYVAREFAIYKIARSPARSRFSPVAQGKWDPSMAMGSSVASQNPQAFWTTVKTCTSQHTILFSRL